jgi:TonB family protein
MTLVLDTTIRITLILTGALAATWLLRNRSAALRHWVLALAVLSTGLMPLLQTVAPAWELPFDVRPQNRPVAAQTADPTAQSPGSVSIAHSVTLPRTPIEAPRSVTLTRAALWIWAAGTAVSFGVLVLALARLSRLASRARVVSDAGWKELAGRIASGYALRRRLQLLQSPHPGMLATWGLLRPRVMLPAGADAWPDDRRRVVLAHELAHVQRGDWAVQIAAECLRAIFWFHPIVWITCRQLREHAERACDDLVLRGGVEGTEYATHLMELARASRGVWSPATAMAHTPRLEGRIRAMLDTRLNRVPPSRSLRAAVAVAAALVTTVSAGCNARAQQLGSLSGSVVDPSDRPVPNATLVLTNAATQAKFEVRTDASGRYEFVGLPPGEYVFENRAMGFQRAIGRLPITGAHAWPVKLQLGSVMETIHVLAGTGEPAPGQHVPDQRILDRRDQKRDPADCVATAAGGAVRAPYSLVRVNPRYPPHLAGVEGTVTLDAVLGSDGTVRDIRPSSGGTPAHPELEAAAIDAVRQWEFDPTLLNCVPVDVRMTVTVDFKSRR